MLRRSPLLCSLSSLSSQSQAPVAFADNHIILLDRVDRVVPTMEDDLDIPRSKRCRKQPSFPSTFSAPKPQTIEIGSGILLAEYPHFSKALEKQDDNKVIRRLHDLLFDCKCEKDDVKRNVRSFSGFPAATNLDEKIDKVSKDKVKWTADMVMIIAAMFGLDDTGDRNLMISQLVRYLANPTVIKEDLSAEKKNTGKTPKSNTKSKATKKKQMKSEVAPAYILFSTGNRDDVKLKYPLGSFAFVANKINELWHLLDPEDKKQWELIATESKWRNVADEEAETVQLEYNEVEVSDKDLRNGDGVSIADVLCTHNIELAN